MADGFDKAWDVNPWHPITDRVDLKHLGKFSEECGEAISATARCIIQGMDEKDPRTGVVNRDWLQDEIADVIANAELVILRFNLDYDYILERAERKKDRLRKWHEMA